MTRLFAQNFSALAARGGRITWVLLTTGAFLLSAATSADAGDNILIPLRWCAVEGSDAVEAPGGEANTNWVLWRRHERASDNIWIPGANITFRSGVTEDIRDTASFPIIPDPKLPSAGGPGVEGDILDPDFGTQEFNDVVADCLAAWNRDFPSARGPIAVNIRRFVDNSGNPTTLGGQSNFAITGTPGATLDQACTSPETYIANNNGDEAYVVIIDNSFTLPTDPHDQLLAHELGHVLFLHHGNGLDDDGDGKFDLFCDSDEDVNAPPPCLMSATGSSEVITAIMRSHTRAVAKVTDGATMDPPGVLVDGDTVSGSLVDTVHDVADESVDIVVAGMAENTVTETTIFSHRLFGRVPWPPNHHYLFFVDLDNDPATGGAPSDLGLPTGFQGAELVTRVFVEVAGEFWTVTPTVWKFQGGAFVEVDHNDIRAEVVTSVGRETEVPLFDAVRIKMPNSVRGPAGVPVRIQAVAERLGGRGQQLERDQVPDGASDAGGDVALVPPQFPICSVTPEQVQPGGTAIVEVSGLIPNDTANVILGYEPAASGPIDGNGNAAIPFPIPHDAPEGTRLVTVGVMGTALTADCFVDVLAAGDMAIDCPTLVVVECDESVDPADIGSATVRQACGEAEITFSDVDISGNCPQERIIQRVWIASDECQNVASCVQTISVDDATAPEITCPSETVIGCGGPTDPAATGWATATDNCDPEPFICWTDSVQPGECPVITRTWVAIDACGNRAFCDQTVTGADCLCGDLDGNGAVDGADFVTFAGCFGLTAPAGGCSAEEFYCSDLLADGEVNLADFVIFAEAFGAPPSGSPPDCP